MRMTCARQSDIILKKIFFLHNTYCVCVDDYTRVLFVLRVCIPTIQSSLQLFCTVPSSQQLPSQFKWIIYLLQCVRNAPQHHAFAVQHDSVRVIRLPSRLVHLQERLFQLRNVHTHTHTIRRKYLWRIFLFFFTLIQRITRESCKKNWSARHIRCTGGIRRRIRLSCRQLFV